MMETQTTQEAARLTPAGWAMMLVSLSFVWGLAIWCFRRVLTAPPDDHVVKPPDSLGG